MKNKNKLGAVLSSQTTYVFIPPPLEFNSCFFLNKTNVFTSDHVIIEVNEEKHVFLRVKILRKLPKRTPVIFPHSNQFPRHSDDPNNSLPNKTIIIPNKL